VNNPPRPPYPNAPECSPAHQPPEPPGPQPTPILNPPTPLTAEQLLIGTPTDNVFPRRPIAGVPPIDGRSVALKALGVYLTSLPYARVGQIGGNPVYFGIPYENYFIDRQAEPNELPFPSIAATDGPVESKKRGFQPQPNYSTRDQFGQGTILYMHEEREEIVPLEVWSSTHPELRSIVATIEAAFHPTQERNGFLLRLPDYYWQSARFMLERTEWAEEASAVKNRRMAKIHVWMSYDVVHLVNYVTMLQQSVVDTEIPTTASPLVIAPDPSIGGQSYPSGPPP